MCTTRSEPCCCSGTKTSPPSTKCSTGSGARGPSIRGALPRPMQVPARLRSTVRTLVSGESSRVGDGGPSDAPVDDLAGDTRVAVRTYSADQVWRRKDFSAFTPDDIARAKAALARLTWNPGMRVTRRWMPGLGGHRRSPPTAPRQLETRRRDRHDSLSPAPDRAAAADPDLRRQRIDGSLHAHAAAVRARDRRRHAARRRLRILDTPHARDPRVRGAGRGCRA